MTNNRKTTKGRQRQIVYSEPRKTFVKKYLSPKGLRLSKQSGITKEALKEIWNKYGKNRYSIIPIQNCIQLKQIIHS